MHGLARCTPLLVACLLPAATLEKLSLDDMVHKSTAIVHGRVQASSTSVRGIAGRGGIIYTHFAVQVLEQWKGAPLSRVDVAVPGGAVQGRQQSFPGAPALNLNSEYVLFLWTSPAGLTQIIGLSQGLMTLHADASGNLVLSRFASQERMVDASGATVSDRSFSMSLGDFRATMTKYGMARN